MAPAPESSKWGSIRQIRSRSFRLPYSCTKEHQRVGQVLLLNLTSQMLANNTFNKGCFRRQVELRNLTYDHYIIEATA